MWITDLQGPPRGGLCYTAVQLSSLVIGNIAVCRMQLPVAREYGFQGRSGWRSHVSREQRKTCPESGMGSARKRAFRDTSFNRVNCVDDKVSVVEGFDTLLECFPFGVSLQIRESLRHLPLFLKYFFLCLSSFLYSHPPPHSLLFFLPILQQPSLNSHHSVDL